MKKVLFLGDSISIHYSKYLKKYSEGICKYCFRSGMEEAKKNLDIPTAGNCGSSEMLLKYIKELCVQGSAGFDCVVFNCGLHDIKTDSGTGTISVNAGKYRENLLEIIETLEYNGITPVWISTTPIDDGLHNSRALGFYRYNRDVIKYNQIASRIMEKNKVGIIDLYDFTLNFGREAFEDHAHFSESVRKLQAAYILGFLQCFLNRENGTA